MSNKENEPIVKMVRLGEGFDSSNRKLTLEEIEQKKKATRLYSEARERAKIEHCLLCGKACTSFCNSHSVPQFALQKIAVNGMVSETLQSKAPTHEKSIGISQTGTFHIICNDCDSRCFQEYETPSAYSKQPSNVMLAQIALKNYLLQVNKRLVERELYTLIGERFPNKKEVADEKVFIGDYDLLGYLSSLEYSQKAIKHPDDKYYHLCFYKLLDYVVPYTAQSAITMVGDFNDEVINNLYSISPHYRMRDIHVAVFPLESTSVVMLFIENEDKRYRKFYKQLSKLPLEDQLSAINYIVFSNIENVFINPQVQEKVIENKHFLEACRLTTDTISQYDCTPEELLYYAIKEFSLSKRKDVPNLLSREYALK